MKPKILWQASQLQKNKSNLFKYEKFLFSKFRFKVTQKYSSLLRWSIDNPKNFWNTIWDLLKSKELKLKSTKNLKYSIKINFLKIIN